MFKVFKLIGICFLVCCCSFQETEKSEVNRTKAKVNLETSCEIPSEVQSYLTENSDKWFNVGLSDFNEELLSFLSDLPNQENSQYCPHFVFGDFTNDGKEDFAVILKSKTYRVDEYDDYIFPFLLVFNDFKETIDPHVVHKTGDYEQEGVKTVIYSDPQQGILSYLGAGSICGMNVIDVTYFEKSGFFVYWNHQSNSYRFLNYLDENLCEEVNAVKMDSHSLIGEWSSDCNYELTEFSINDRNELFLSLSSNNAIYINCVLELDTQKKDTYNIFFSNVDSQKYYYEDEKNIVEGEISKKDCIGTVKILGGDTLELDWKGLFNLKTKEIDFAKDFLLLIDNDNIAPIVLKKCVE